MANPETCKGSNDTITRIAVKCGAGALSAAALFGITGCSGEPTEKPVTITAVCQNPDNPENSKPADILGTTINRELNPDAGKAYPNTTIFECRRGTNATISRVGVNEGGPTHVMDFTCPSDIDPLLNVGIIRGDEKGNNGKNGDRFEVKTNSFCKLNGVRIAE